MVNYSHLVGIFFFFFLILSVLLNICTFLISPQPVPYVLFSSDIFRLGLKNSFKVVRRTGFRVTFHAVSSYKNSNLLVFFFFFFSFDSL